MPLFRWRCWLRAVWYVLTNPPALAGPFAGAFTSGHLYQNEEEDVLALVTTGRCVDCGKPSVTWKRRLT